FTSRILSAVSHRTPGSELIRTNMGIDRRYSCLIPRSHSNVIFGRPDLDVGERGPLELAAVLPQESDAFVDIGANVGYFTFYVRCRLPTRKPIYFFEPDPDLYGLIERNVALSSLVNVHGSSNAVAAKTGRVNFYKNLSDSLSGSLETIFMTKHELQ